MSFDHVETYAHLAQKIVDAIDWPSLLGTHASCQEFTDDCQSAFVESLAKPVFRRLIGADTQTRFSRIFAAARLEGDTFEVGAKLVLRAMLQSPRFLYRIEEQGPGGDEGLSTRDLDDWEMASRISYLIWGSSPDDTLFAEAEAGRIRTAAEIDVQVTRLLSDARAVDHSLRYLGDWLGLDTLDVSVRDPDEFPDWGPLLAADMRQEVIALARNVWWEEAEPMIGVFTAQYTFASPRLAALYGLPDPQEGVHRYDLSDVPERMGLLTQAALLTVKGGSLPSIVQRGLFVLRDLMCSDVAPPPPGVDAVPKKGEPGKSQRFYSDERVENPGCSPCHTQFDPLAWSFEPYDGVGRYRLEDTYGNQMRQDGELLLQDGSLAAFETTEAFVQLLVASEQTRSCMVEKPIQFAIGRPVGLVDTCTLSDIRESVRRRGWDLHGPGPGHHAPPDLFHHPCRVGNKMPRYRNVLSRRTLLRGAGTVAIGLPFLDAMRSHSVYGKAPDPPARAIAIFFGLGVPKQVQAKGFVGALGPLAPFADRLALVRGVNLLQGMPGNGGNHFQGGGAVFVGAKPENDSRAGGPSIDQVILGGKYPGGSPTLISTLLAASFFRRGTEATRYVHSWRPDGSPTALPIETPKDLFACLFGEDPGTAPSEEADKALRYRRSTLDTVLDEYRHYKSDASNLGAESRQRISDHLDKIRELEKKVFPEGPLDCMAPPQPGDLPLLHGQPVDPDGDGVDLDVAEWETLWQLHCDLYALAFQCDLCRFGNLCYQSGGERIRLHGDYVHAGQLVEAFDDAETSHEYWHRHKPGEVNEDNRLMEQHTHFIMAQLAYFLDRLADPSYPDENGKTLLENAFLMLGTELGDGGRHDLESVFHAVGPANGTFRVGQILDVSATDVDLYNTCLTGMGVDERMGDLDNWGGELTGLLA
ncbi:MAG: DUF1552 domain-containing protein [Nannocystaceae bacterium]